MPDRLNDAFVFAWANADALGPRCGIGVALDEPWPDFRAFVGVPWTGMGIGTGPLIPVPRTRFGFVGVPLEVPPITAIPFGGWTGVITPGPELVRLKRALELAREKARALGCGPSCAGETGCFGPLVFFALGRPFFDPLMNACVTMSAPLS